MVHLHLAQTRLNSGFFLCLNSLAAPKTIFTNFDDTPEIV
jgi:hypothetical protein